MSFKAGETATAARINRLAPTPYRAAATSTLTGPQTSADVPGATVTFTTETDGAAYVVEAVFDYRNNATGTSSQGSGNIAVDNVVQSEFAIFRDGGGSANTSMTVAQVYKGTLTTAGSHTIKLVASPVLNQVIQVYSSITITIYEVV